MSDRLWSKLILNKEILRQLFASAALALMGSVCHALDTDIYTALGTSGAAPNVLIVVDNTSNYSRADQHFPNASTQGAAEFQALQSVISGLKGNVNVGVMQFDTLKSGDNGGFVTFAIKPVGDGQATNKNAFVAKMADLAANVGSSGYKTNSGIPYGDLFYDIYNYLTGVTPFAGPSFVNPALADSAGYTSNAYTQFSSPLSTNTLCSNVYVIFIGNPDSRGPTKDTSANYAALNALGGQPNKQLPLPGFSLATKTISTVLGNTSACYTSAPTGTPTDYATQCAASYDSCSYGTAGTTTMNACPTGQSRYDVYATTPAISNTSSVTTQTTVNGTTRSSYTTSSAATAAVVTTGTDTGGLSCPANTTATVGSTITTTSYNCTYALGSQGSPSSPQITVSGPTNVSPIVQSATTTTCYNPNGNQAWSAGSPDIGGVGFVAPTDAAGLNPALAPFCPANSTSGSTTTTYNCNTYSYSGVQGSNTGCSGSKVKEVVTLSASPLKTVTTSTPTYYYGVVQTINKTVTTSTISGSNTPTRLGNTSACYSSAPTSTSSDYASTCTGNTVCTYSYPATTNICPSGLVYPVLGNIIAGVETPTGVSTIDTATYNADEWARFMHTSGIPIGGGTQTINFYTIDVYNAAPNATESSLYDSIAINGGGKYFTAVNPAQINTALGLIFSEIQGTNSSFASASLPISATNRSQNGNQVFIGMFRPDTSGFPRWFGNLKQYQIGSKSGVTTLVDANFNYASSSGSLGFIAPCATSFWTTDSTLANGSSYWYDTVNDMSRVFITQATTPGLAWQTAGDDSAQAKGGCANTSLYSDSPDGPIIEKGGAAEVLRGQTSRNMYTLSGSSLVNFTPQTFSSTSSTTNTNIVNFIKGLDVTGEVPSASSSNNRPSIHGDVLHSRPLPVDYGGDVSKGGTGVVVYYGANDGTLKAVNAPAYTCTPTPDSGTCTPTVPTGAGKELWSFVAPESFSALQRLMDNTPVLQTPYPLPPGVSATNGATPKDFFFDGTVGLYQTFDSNNKSSKAWIFASMRRGGRMIYAFDVSDPKNPVFKWKVGCPNLTNDLNCTNGFTGIGQTWSTPEAVILPGYSTDPANPKPVVVFGGGYDTCEDNESKTPSCSNAKGAGVYIVDADTGVLLANLAVPKTSMSPSGTSMRSVVGDVALVDVNQDGIYDTGYLSDTGGNIYRIDFANPASNYTPLSCSTSACNWTIKQVAYTNGGYRKFLFGPAVLPFNKYAYVALVSGDREHPLSASYPATTPVANRAYVYLDDPTGSDGARSGGAIDLDLTSTAIDATSASCTSSALLPGSSTKYDWYLPLSTNPGTEQGVTSALIFGGTVAFSTNQPTAASSSSCTSSLGHAYGYQLNLFNGSSALGVGAGICGGTTLRSEFLGGGLPPSPVLGRVTFTSNGSPVTQTVVIGVAPKDGSKGSQVNAQSANPKLPIKRSKVYWTNKSDNY
ncbi:PilC/PilY family type IV pilus protein [Rhodoferax sp. GW822-FHT02A01]|uniref:PilC/PilY family type IV pilus protein n=1 Tax=Rhodoferax sp. GW822-FHT02A01 TaxID=3141537 RepID=UPI00315CF84F